jgi:hypothetical protein
MKKRILSVILLTIAGVTALAASHNRTELAAPVCRFVGFYVSAERSDMTAWERVMYGLAVARGQRDAGCSVQPLNDNVRPAIPE